MPNVNGKDVNVSLEENILIISGYQRSRTSYDDDSPSSGENENHDKGKSHHHSMAVKRKRLSRRLEIDLNVIDVNRAMASTWNGCLTLYAPKRRATFSDCRRY